MTDTTEHKCVFKPALDLRTLEGWQECDCGKKRKFGQPYHRPINPKHHFLKEFTLR